MMSRVSLCPLQTGQCGGADPMADTPNSKPGREHEREIVVFISSQGDVPKEREAVQRVLGELNEAPNIKRLYRFEWVAYETDAPAIMGQEPTTTLNANMMRASQAHVYVGIFCHRFGTPPKDEDGNPLRNKRGDPYQSGTEYEFDDAYHMNQETHGARPIMLLYRGRKPLPSPDDPAQRKQRDSVDAFFKRIGHKGEYKGLPKEFRSLEEFEKTFREDMLRLFGQRRVDI